MIPSMLVLGLIIGLTPKPWYQGLTVLAGFCWVGLQVLEGTVDSGTAGLLFTFIFGLVNVIVGVMLSRMAVRMIRDALQDL